MRALFKNRFTLTLAAALAGGVAVGFYRLFGVLALAVVGLIAAVLNAYFDDKLTRPRLFLAVGAAVITFGSAWLSVVANKEANERSRQFEDALKSATNDLLKKTSDVASLASQNAALSRSLAAKSDEIAAVNRSVAFPLNGNLVAHVAMTISGSQPTVASLAARLHALAFPDGRQKFGYWTVDLLDSRIEEQKAMANFVGHLSLSFAFCAKQSCDFAAQLPTSDRPQGVQMQASAGLGPEIENSLAQANPTVRLVKLGRHVTVRYDANSNRFLILLESEPLQFFI